MRMPTALGACIVVLIIIGVLVVSGVGAEKQAGEENARKVSGEVYETLAEEGKVRVYITFQKERDGRVSQTAAEDVRNIVGRSAIKYDYGDRLSASITNEELALLERNPRVARIESIGMRRIQLQSSAALVNATHASPLQVGGINLTGAGRTICIIDTGVNYSHVALGGCYGNSSSTSTCKVWGGFDYCADNSGCTTQDEIPDDVHGHGTHVAGIAAANGNGTLRGVAPDARIVMLKACRSSDGACSDDDINKSIYWCIGNRTALNISVISMSLGSTPSTSGYCNTDALAASINEAVGFNITVVIAAGNNGNTTSISAPACVENATAIGSIQKDDATFNYNRNNITLLVAPGFQINSTAVGGGYVVQSGTSMATPHVAGAVAVLTGYLNLTGRQRTPAQVVSTLNSTGRRVYDSGSNLNYSRINLYDAIISLDIAAPDVALVSPSNGTSSLETNQTFRCNATDLALRNATLFVWNASSSILNQSTRTTSGAAAALEFNASNLSRGTHQWNCLFVDENNNVAFVSPNRTITIADLTTTLAAPSDGVIVNANQTLSCNATTTATLSNSTLYVWNASGSTINTTVQNTGGVANTTNFSYNFLNESAHTWNCLFFTGTSLQQFASANFSITYDVTRPRVNLTTPANNSWQNKGNFNATLNENGTCLASFTGGVVNTSLSSADNRAFNASNATLVHGTNYTVFYYCNDSAGNLNASTRQSFTIDLTAPNITLLAPNNSYNLTASSTTVVFNYSVSDELNISSCSLILDGAVNQTNTTITNLSANQSFTKSLNAAAYTWLVNCTDEAGNAGNSSSRTITISAPASSSSSGGGGGGGGGGGAATILGTTYRPTLSDVQQGYTKSLKASDKIAVAIPTAQSSGSAATASTSSSGSVATVEHTVTVDNVTDTKAYLVIRSEPVNVTLGVGESVRLNLTSPVYYDLFVKLESIVNRSANVTVKVINEPFVMNVSNAVLNETTASSNASGNQTGLVSNEGTKERRAWIVYLIVGFVLVLIVAVGSYLYWYWRRQQNEGAENPEDR